MNWGCISGDQVPLPPGAAAMHVDLAVHGVRRLAVLMLGGMVGVATARSERRLDASKGSRSS